MDHLSALSLLELEDDASLEEAEQVFASHCGEIQKRLEAEIDIGGATGEAREIRQMQLESAKALVLVRSDQDRVLRCLCDALLQTNLLPLFGS